MSGSVAGTSYNGGASSSSVPARTPGIFKGSATPANEEGGHQPPAPPHRSFSSDVGLLPNVSTVFSPPVQSNEQSNR